MEIAGRLTGGMVSKVNEWVIHARRFFEIVLMLSLVAFAASAVWDRSPPFKVLRHDTIHVHAGTVARIDVAVWRDMDRHCDATLDRYIFDADHRRFDLLGGAKFSDSLIREFEAKTPGRLSIGVPIPPLRVGDSGIAPGPALLVSALEYSCTKGQTYLWPIQVKSEIRLFIEP